MTATANDLNAGFEILWYRIESVLGRGGFGITYLATDTNLGKHVAIKEYLPHDFASRGEDSTVQPISQEREDMYTWGLDRFMKEAKTLAKFQHPNICRVLSVFQQNNTGYMVMEYEEGNTLMSLIDATKPMVQSEVEKIFYPIMHGLAAVHAQGFIHRDIKPANILIRKDGSPVLLDFGAARQAVGVATRTLTAMLTVGYAPLEQYNEGTGKQGPWTDVYALGACMYHCIAGKKPPEATQRSMAIVHGEPDSYIPLSFDKPDGFESFFLRGIDQSLMLKIQERPQSLSEFEDLLTGQTKLEPLLPKQFSSSPDFLAETLVRPVESLVTERVPTQELPAKASSEIAAEPPPPADKGHSKLKLFVAAGLVGLVVLVAIRLIMLSLAPDEPITDTTASVDKPEVVTESPKDEVSERVRSLLLQAQNLVQPDSGIQDLLRAVPLYQQVLELDDQNSEAIDALRQLTARLAESARDQIRQGDLASAQTTINAIQSVDANHQELNGLIRALENSTQTAKQREQLDRTIAQAQRALEAGNVYTPAQTSAYAYFRRALTIEPNNPVVLDGLLTVFDILITEGLDAIKQGDTSLSKRLIDLARSINPESSDIEMLEKQYSTLVKVKQLTTAADQAYRNNRFTLPQDQNAVALYKQVLRLAPSDSHAKQQLDKIAEFYDDKVQSAITSKNVSAAKTNLKKLELHFPDHSGLSVLSDKVDALAKASVKKPKAPSKTPTPAAAPAKPAQNLAGLLPEGINQTQGDAVVVQDIVSRFMQYFNAKDIQGLSQVSQIGSDETAYFENIFNYYESLSLELVPGSFSIQRIQGLAKARFTITNLVDKNGRRVNATGQWTHVEITSLKKNGQWLKVTIGSF